MTRALCVTTSLVASAVLIAVAGCTQPRQQPTSTVTPTSATSTSVAPSTSTSTSQSPNEQRIAAASAVVRRYISTYDALGQNSALPISELLKVTRDAAYNTWSSQVQRSRANEWRQTGGTQLLSVVGVVGPAKVRPTVTVTICYDVSQVKIVDKTGKSVVSPERRNQAKAVYTVQSYKDGWFITDDDTRGEPCNA